MFQHLQTDQKAQRLCFEKTGINFNQTGQDDSFSLQIQAEKEYVLRLKIQRQKIEALYSKYDILLKDLKSKQLILKEKDRTIYNLQTRCKGLAETNEQMGVFKQQNNTILTQNHNLHKAISQLQQSYGYLNEKLRTKEAVTQHKYEQLQTINDQLKVKLRNLNKKIQQNQQAFSQKYHKMNHQLQQTQLQLTKSRENYFIQLQYLKQVIFEKQQDCNLLKMDNACLKQRVAQLESTINHITHQLQDKIQTIQKQRKIQVKSLKNEMDSLKQTNSCLQKKLNKFKQQSQLKQLSLSELSIVLQRQQRQFNEILLKMRKQYGQQKAILKEQLIQCQNHISKMQRKLLDGQRKQQCLYGKIKKYEVCLDAKRHLRRDQKQQLQKISNLLNHS